MPYSFQDSFLTRLNPYKSGLLHVSCPTVSIEAIAVIATIATKAGFSRSI